MTSRSQTQDTLDQVLDELERARTDPEWIEEEERPSRRRARTPDVLDTGRWVPSRAAVLCVAACALLAAAIFTVRWLLSDTGSTRPVAPPASVAVSGSPSFTAASSATASTGSPGAAAPTAASGQSTAQRWHVHVVGAVRHPGVVVIARDSRVSDAVTAAGGLDPQADAAAINLARPLTDGEQIHVPRPGENWTPPPDAAPGGSTGGAAAIPGAKPGSGAKPGQSEGSAAGASGTVRLNEATLEQLDSLPGVGPVMAQRILDWRQEHGRFTSVDELGEVSGIGDKTLERLRPKVSV